MRIDLHTHSNRSDGTDAPAALVRKAAAPRTEGGGGLDVVALTDHDATTGWDEAGEAAERAGIRLVPGIEISTIFEGSSVHLLGYAFDPEHPDLVAELERVLQGREQRLPRVLARLAEHGIDISVADVEAHSGNAAASGRPHIADAMVAAGYVPNRDAAFNGWLNTGGKAHVERYSAPLRRAIELIGSAGGRTVIAHPWSRDSHRVLTAEAIADLRDGGLDGIEVDHNDHDEDHRQALRQIAADLDLVVTGSSDYHGLGKRAEFSLGCHTTAPEEFERLLG